MKKIIIIIALTFSYHCPLYSSEHCKELNKLSLDYIKCIGKNVKEKSSNLSLNTENIKEKKTISDWFKKKNDS